AGPVLRSELTPGGAGPERGPGRRPVRAIRARGPAGCRAPAVAPGARRVDRAGHAPDRHGPGAGRVVAPGGVAVRRPKRRRVVPRASLTTPDGRGQIGCSEA